MILRVQLLIYQAGYLPMVFFIPSQAATARFASFAVSVPLPSRITLLARPDLGGERQVACHGALRTEMSEINMELLVANIHLILMFVYWFLLVFNGFKL